MRHQSYETGTGAVSTLDCVESLLDKNLLLQVGGEGEEPRLTMLETIREYGLERLHESGEALVCQQAHALYYLALAEQAEPHLKGAQQVLWWKRLEQEQENLRAALTWLIGQEEGELALRLSGVLWWFWNIRGYWSEGRRWLEAALGLPQAQELTTRRAKVLCGAGECTHRLGHPVARLLVEESVVIYRKLGDKGGLTESLGRLGMILHRSTQDSVTATRTLLEKSLMLAREVGDDWILANMLFNLGTFMYDRHDFKNARLFWEESVTLYRELQDHHALSHALHALAELTVYEGGVTQAAALAQESLALARELNNGPNISRALYCLAFIQSMQGDTEQALVLFEKSLALAREQGDKIHIGITLYILGSGAALQGDLLRAETYAQESLTLFRALGNKRRTSLALNVLGDIRRIQGELTLARAIFEEGVLLAGETGSHYSMGRNLIGLARIAADEGQPERAAHLFGAAEPWLNSNLEMDPDDRADYERAVERVRAQLDEQTFASAWAEGRAMTPEQVLAIPAPQMMPTIIPTPAKVPFTYPNRLTPREMEVLRLLAQGLTSAQIAEQLVIGVVTVNFHVRSIYGKLGVTSRSAATRYALEHHLL